MSATFPLRRARPLLGTLVEIGACGRADADDGNAPGRNTGAAAHGPASAIEAAFARIASVQATLSRFEPTSDIARFNAAAAGACVAIDDDARVVLAAAAALRDASDGAFDVTLGTGAWQWRVDERGLHKLAADVRIDLGGIAKGHAVDCAVDTLVAAGVERGWVNAGGDLRAFGGLALPIDLRDEGSGGVRRFATLEDGAFATSRADHAAGVRHVRHVSVAAPQCMFADALTKIVLATGDPAHRLLAEHAAAAWVHASPCPAPA